STDAAGRRAAAHPRNAAAHAAALWWHHRGAVAALGHPVALRVAGLARRRGAPTGPVLVHLDGSDRGRPAVRGGTFACAPHAPAGSPRLADRIDRGSHRSAGPAVRLAVLAPGTGGGDGRPCPRPSVRLGGSGDC